MKKHLTEPERRIVKEAYRGAVDAGASRRECYLAGIRALQRLYPDVKQELLAHWAIAAIAEEISLADFEPKF
jgi:hypothetical protein